MGTPDHTFQMYHSIQYIHLSRGLRKDIVESSPNQSDHNFVRGITKSGSLRRGWFLSLTSLIAMETVNTSLVAIRNVSAGHGLWGFSPCYSLPLLFFASVSKRLTVPSMAWCMTFIRSNSAMLCRLAASTLVHLGESCHGCISERRSQLANNPVQLNTSKALSSSSSLQLMSHKMCKIHASRKMDYA